MAASGSNRRLIRASISGWLSLGRGGNARPSAGRQSASSAWMISAAMPMTVISPSVSKPRKSTMMTLTALAPPPCGTVWARK